MSLRDSVTTRIQQAGVRARKRVMSSRGNAFDSPQKPEMVAVNDPQRVRAVRRQ